MRSNGAHGLHRDFEETTRCDEMAVGLTRSSHEALDEVKRRLASAVVSRFPVSLIRSNSLANLDRWRAQGTWVPAYDEWKRIMREATDEDLIAVMLGTSERSVELRQSAPYVGLLPADEVKRINEEAS